MSTGVGDIYMDLRLDKKNFERDLNSTKSSAERIGSGIGKAIGGAIAVAVSAVGLKSIITKTAQVGDAVDKMSQKLGMSSQAYQEWDFIMQRCGTSIESMQMGMKTLASSAVTSKDALAELGITQAEVASLSQEQLFARTISALQDVEDTTRRTYLAGQLLGRGATELGALLNMSASDTEQLRQRMAELGGIMSQTAVTNSAMFTDALTDIKMSFRSIYNSIAETILPLITQAINSVIIPAIQRACAVLQYFMNLFASFFGGIKKKAGGIKGALGAVFGKVTGKFADKTAKSIGGVGNGVGGVGKKAKKAKKAVKELKRELMGFDKINKLEKKDKSGGGGGVGGAGGGGGGAGGLGDMGGEIADTNSGLGIMGKLVKKLRPLWKALGDIFSAIVRLVKALVKAFKPVAKFFWETLIKPLGKLIGMAVIGILEGIAGAIELLARFVEKYPNLSVALIGIAGGLFLLAHKGAGVPKFLRLMGGAFKFVGRAIMAHPIIAIIAGIAIAIGLIYKNWDKIKKTRFGKLLIRIGKLLKPLVSTILDLANKAIGKAGRAIQKLTKKMSPVFKVLKKIGIFLGNAFLDKIEGVVSKVEAFKNAWGAIKDKTVELKSKVEEGIENLFSGIGDTVSVAISLTKKGWTTITAFVGNAVSTAVSLVKSGWTSISSFVGTAVSTAVSLVKSGWSSIKKFVGSAVSVGIKLFKSGWKTISKYIGTAVSVGIKLFKNGWKSISSFIGTKVKVGISLFKSGWKSLKSFFGLKKGGYVTSHGIKMFGAGGLPNKGQMFYARESGPELVGTIGGHTAVMNNNQIVASVSNGVAKAIRGIQFVSKKSAPPLAIRNGSAFGTDDDRVLERITTDNREIKTLLRQLINEVKSVDADVYLDGKEITRNTVKNINQQTRTTGRSPILV